MKLRSSYWGAVAAALALAACGGSGGGTGQGGGGGPGGSGQGGSGQGGAGSMSIAAICDAYCDCVGCSTIVRDGCAGTWANEQMAAAAKGCVTNYDALVDCLITTATCSGGMTSDQCDAERMALDACLK